MKKQYIKPEVTSTLAFFQEEMLTLSHGGGTEWNDPDKKQDPTIKDPVGELQEGDEF